MVMGMEYVDFSGAWDRFWADFAPGLSPDVVRLAATVGVLLVVYAIIKFFYERSGRGAGRTDHLPYVLALGVILVSPTVAIPFITRVVDAVVNTVLSAVN